MLKDGQVIAAGNTNECLCEENLKKLYDISKSINESTYLVQDESEIKKEWFRGCEKIGITAGASTPEEIVINIENKIRGIFNV